MVTELVPSEAKWLFAIGNDGAAHIIPIGEEHLIHHGCYCNPIQQFHYSGMGSTSFLHRSLSC